MIEKLWRWQTTSFIINCSSQWRSVNRIWQREGSVATRQSNMAGNGGGQKLRLRARNHRLDEFDREHEGTWRGPFTFIASADTQYGMFASWDDPAAMDWHEEVALTRRGVARINQMRPRPRFVVILGDMVDAMPGHPSREGQKNSFIEEFNRLDPEIPLVCLPGNHDVGDSPSPGDIQLYRDTFGDDFYSFWVGGVRFIVLNSQVYANPTHCQKAREEHDAWLDKELEDVHQSQCKHVVVFQHIPWFLKSPREENDYFNTDIRLRLPMLEKLHKAGVRIIFCGHYHRNAGGFYKGMEEVVISAWGKPLGEDKSGLSVVQVAEESITHQYYDVDSVPLE